MFIHSSQRITAFVTKSIDAGQEANTVLWTPLTDAKIVIFDVIVSTSSATTVTVFYDTDDVTHRIFKGYFQANQGVVMGFSGNFTLPKNSVIKITNTEAISSITILGMEI